MFPSVGSAYNVVCKLALRVLKRSPHINHVTELDGRQDTSERCKSIINGGGTCSFISFVHLFAQSVQKQQ